MTHYSPYAGTSAGHNYLTEPTCVNNHMMFDEQGAAGSPSLTSTWIWSVIRVAWSRRGLPCLWLAAVAGRRRGSPRRTSTGVYSSWSWPAGTQTYAPARDPAQWRKKLFVSRPIAECGRFIGRIHVTVYKPDHRPPPQLTWGDFFWSPGEWFWA